MNLLLIQGENIRICDFGRKDGMVTIISFEKYYPSGPFNFRTSCLPDFLISLPSQTISILHKLIAE